MAVNPPRGSVYCLVKFTRHFHDTNWGIDKIPLI